MLAAWRFLVHVNNLWPKKNYSARPLTSILFSSYVLFEPEFVRVPVSCLDFFVCGDFVRQHCVRDLGLCH